MLIKVKLPSPCTPCNMQSLIIKFTNKYSCFYTLFKVREA